MNRSGNSRFVGFSRACYKLFNCYRIDLFPVFPVRFPQDQVGNSYNFVDADLCLGTARIERFFTYEMCRSIVFFEEFYESIRDA